MEIYSNASTARINFRLSFARPPTNLPLHDRDLARPPPKCPPLLRIFAPLSANDLQRRWHQGLPPIRIVPTSRSSLSFFLFILFYSSSPAHFIRGRHPLDFSELYFFARNQRGSCARVRTFRLTYLRVENIRMEKTGYYYARVSYERGRGKNFARKFRIRVLRCR